MNLFLFILRWFILIIQIHNSILLFTIYICNLLISKINEKRTKTISEKNYPRW